MPARRRPGDVRVAERLEVGCRYYYNAETGRAYPVILKATIAFHLGRWIADHQVRRWYQRGLLFMAGLLTPGERI